LQNATTRLPAARKKAQRLQAEADSALAEAEALKVQARLEDLNMWERELVKESKKGPKTYTYWMASWREADKTRWPGEHQEDGCRGGQAESQADEGGGTWSS